MEMELILNLLFLILQRYDFSSKSQLFISPISKRPVVSYIAKIRFFEQITTDLTEFAEEKLLFLILQRYDFSSKSQPSVSSLSVAVGCFLYCKDTIFRANHNGSLRRCRNRPVVSYIAKIRFFEQITTNSYLTSCFYCCFLYCKDTIFRANHNKNINYSFIIRVVSYIAKIRFFEQITTITKTDRM